MDKININQFEKRIEKIEKDDSLKYDNEYNISLGNTSYFKVICHSRAKFSLKKINKKSENIILIEKRPRYVLEHLINVATNSEKI